MRQKSLKKWVRSLIIKAIGKSFSIEYLKSSLRRIWKITPPLQSIALGKGFYNVTIPSEEAREGILSKGPWFVAGHMLFVQPWTPGFKPSQAVISKAPVWVSLPELPIEFHTKPILHRIANEIGAFIRTDMNTIEQNRVRFARIQILLDLAKQRKEAVWLGAFKQPIHYEDTPQFCHQCSTIGHGDERCPQKKKNREISKNGGSTGDADGDQNLGQDVSQAKRVDREEEGEGPWIHVSKKATAGSKKGERKKAPRNKKADSKFAAEGNVGEKGEKRQNHNGQKKKPNGPTGRYTILVQNVTTKLSAQLRKKDLNKAQNKKPISEVDPTLKAIREVPTASIDASTPKLNHLHLSQPKAALQIQSKPSIYHHPPPPNKSQSYDPNLSPSPQQ
ncbi:uncharacterized protein [Spinacia oleracea]|uniref:DUF4283 domain-containing protein n=1 Tax=Spinacia oleracea TaxID=3562 RepID=A0ABM3QYK8_SPIOL|nr:uncharacterized protein LOC130463361 [Spinacia oleracea]